MFFSLSILSSDRCIQLTLGTALVTGPRLPLDTEAAGDFLR